MGIFDSPNFQANRITALENLVEINNMPDNEKRLLLNKMINPYPALTTVEWAVSRLDKWGKDSPLFQSRVLGIFPKISKDTIIALADLEACKDIAGKRTSPRVLGIDVARFGNDDTCFIGAENWEQVYKEKWNGQDLVKTANRAIHLIKTKKINVVVIDDTGLGGGVTDMLHDAQNTGLTFQLIPVNFAEKSNTDEYDDIVTEMYFNVKDLVEHRHIQVEDEGDLFAELSNRKYKFTNRGKIRIESKDDYKKRTGSGSPNEADAFVLCIWGLSYGNIGFTVDEIKGRVFAEETSEGEGGGRVDWKKAW